MDFRNRRHERGSNWTDPEIVELLQLWSDESVQVELESSLRNQRVFDRIARVLQEKGIYRSGDQCREKIKKMRLEYRRIKDNHKTRSWKFYDVMDRVLANRPSITYSSLGGTVIAQQVYQNQGGSDGYQATASAGSFGPASSGGFLFGHSLKPEDPHEIKCEDVDESMVNSSVAPPEMYYGSDDHETDGQSIGIPEEATCQEESAATPRISPSGFSDMNTSGSAATGTQAGSVSHERRFTQAPYPLSSVRQRKRKLAGKASHAHKVSSSANQSRLDRALVSFLKWQQTTEERLLSLEEARLERELRAEERREQQEERKAEQERQHELRLFSMLTGTLVTARQGAQATEVKTTEPVLSQPVSGSQMTSTGLSVTSYLSQPLSEDLAFYTRKKKSSGKACEVSPTILATLRGAETPEHSVYLSKRGNNIRQHQGILQEGYAQYGMDKFHDTDNPNGIINLGTSENKLCYDLLHKRLTKPDMLYMNSSLLQYGDWTGHAFLREVVAKFLTDYCCSPRPLKAANVVVMNGCSSLFSSLAAVICDPKDALLIPTPFYGVITEDLELYSDVKLFHVPLDCEDNDGGYRPFHLTVDKLEEGLNRAKQEGFIIRAVILMNPHNPLAEIYTQKEMIAFLEFAKRQELHAIVDEIYMLTVFDESFTFRSVLSLDSLPDPNRTHVMWGMSKDFAMGGLRIGTLYTENQDLVEALAQLGSFHGIPGFTQHLVAQLLQDREWINNEFLPENRGRLKRAHSLLTKELEYLGIPYLDRPAALFVWADLRKYLRDLTFEDELSLWRCFLRHKVLLSCGQAFSCSTPGWFRIVFADQQHHLELGLRRLKEALEEIEEKHGCPSSSSIKGAIEKSRHSAKEDSADSDNSVFVNSTPSPRSKSSDLRKENDSPFPHMDSFATEERKPADSLDSLIGTLRHQIQSSDWLQKNSPELTAGEDPEILDVFKALLHSAAARK